MMWNFPRADDYFDLHTRLVVYLDCATGEREWEESCRSPRQRIDPGYLDHMLIVC